MYLKQLDLQGFKSFPEKVKLEFNKGITTVVGPNGSGKSNVSDSVRWVLGEQRAKSLRGDRMEDVIFAGTANRKPLGFAEVSITIDNSDKKMSLDYTDIKVTRTVYRSGESRYMINGTVCRLKDVHELFMDTGVGREGYSIIGQGRIDEILSSKSDDRRHLFEEATGIVKYRNRRSEAINKLEKEEQNLLRVEDIINELEEKVEPLREQSEIAKKFLTLKEQLKKYEVNNFCIQAGKIEKSIAEFKEAIEIARNNIQQDQETYEELKLHIADNKQKESKYLAELEKLNNDINNLSTQIEKSEGEIKLCLQEIEHINLNISRLDEEKEAKESKIDEYNNQEALYNSKLTATDLNISFLNQKLKKEEAVFNNLSGILEAGQERLESYKTDIIEKIKESTDLKSKANHLEIMEEQFSDRLEQITRENDYAQSQIFDSQIRISALEKLTSEKNAEQDRFALEMESLENRKNELNIKINENRVVFNQKVSALNESKSKLKILLEMKNDFEGYFKSVKSILKLCGSKGFEGICGAVGEVISVDKRYETAIEIALGAAVQNIITKTEQDAKYSIEYLKRNNLGRSTFLPLTAIKGRQIVEDRETILKAKGYVGIAKELIEYDRTYENVMSSLLDRVIIMDTMDSALILAKATKYRYRLVTIDGDVINAGGTMTGGSIAKKTTNIFGRAREINELQESVAKLELDSCDIEKTIVKYETELTDSNSKMTTINQNIQVIHISLASMEQEAIQCKNSIAEKKERYESSILEERTLSEQIASAKNDVFKIKMDTKKIEEEIENINKELENYQGTVQTEKNERNQVLNRITEIKVSVSASEQDKNGIIDNINRILSEKESVSKEINNTLVQKGIYFAQEREKRIEVENLNKSNTNLKGKRESFSEFKEQMNERFSSLKIEIESLEEKKQNHFETVSKLENYFFKTETKLEKVEEEKERIYNAIWDEYEITYQMAKEQFDEAISVTETTTTTRQIKAEIRDLGSVNVNAIEEYKEVSERYNFLTVQRDDIKNAEEKLQKVIDDLAQMMQKQFKDQFEIINQNFNTVFKEMFGGGYAYLKLSDEGNALESSIEINAQPPGKKLQNMMLLSGGERALTAIAILFAILKMKPSPFCILDEIEAALDEANVKRFARYLKTFSDETQFIIITHRKGTMEVADILYGVTMQEQGVSKVISVKLDEAASEGEV